MVGKIVEIIPKVPAMIEFIIGAVIYLIVYRIGGQVVSGTAEETVCELPGVDSWFLCFILTNEVVAFISMVVIIIVIGRLFRYRFFRGH